MRFQRCQFDSFLLVHIAAAGGIDSIVQKLLEEEGCNANEDLDIEMPFCRYFWGSALLLASKFGHVGVA